MVISKTSLLEHFERKYKPPADLYVCAGCVTDRYLALSLSARAKEETCSYCGAATATEISALLDEINLVISTDYHDPANELPYVSREGGYQGEVYSGTELVYDLEPWTDDQRLVDDVARAFAESHWCKRDYFGLTRYEALRVGWSKFSQEFKHRSRYLFLGELGRDDREFLDEIPPGKMLNALGELFQDHQLFSELPTGTVLVRIRVIEKGERPSTAQELGTAPPAYAVNPNRMSPAGIPMFYASFDDDTSVLETFEPDAEGAEHKELALADFQVLRELQVLDLTSLPEIPSAFNHEQRPDRDPLAFAHSFTRDFSRPVERDGRAHTEYVPTQVVTEYVRHRLRTPDGKRLDGIIYGSSRNPGSKAVVIFADPEHCEPRKNRRPFAEKPLLKLTNVRYEGPKRYKHLWTTGS